MFSVVMAYASSFYDNKMLGFISGTIGSVALILLKFAQYTKNYSKKLTNDTNEILRELKIQGVPDITDDDSNDRETMDEKSVKVLMESRQKDLENGKTLNNFKKHVIPIKKLR